MRAICANMHVKPLTATVVTSFSCSGHREYVQNSQSGRTLCLRHESLRTLGALFCSHCFDSGGVDVPFTLSPVVFVAVSWLEFIQISCV